MTGNPKRTILDSNNIDKMVDLLKEIIEVLEETKNSDVSFASICKSKGLNWQKVRQYLLNIGKCRLINAAPLEEFVTDELDNYEKFYSELFGKKQLIDVRAILPFDYKETVEYVLANTNLSEREVDAIKYRFGFTEDEVPLLFEEIGNKLGICKQGAQQMVTHVMLKLRHPARSRILVKGLSVYMLEHEKSKKEHYDKLAMQEIEYLEEKIKTLRNQNKELVEQILKLQKDNIVENPFLLIESIPLLDEGLEMLDLSVRTYNTLRRSGIKTIKEILELTKENLRKIRHLGTNSEMEIEKQLDNYLQTTCHISLLDYHKTVHKDSIDKYYN